MTSFIRKLWISSAGHCGIAIPVEAFAFIAGKRTEGFDCIITCENNSLVIKPVAEDV